MTETATPRYHHGDLAGALVRAALELLEEQGAAELSLRAAARRAGVSTAAPYRHFAGRNALLSAVAAVGYRDLGTSLAAAYTPPATADGLAAIAIAYVNFALTRPGLFRVMFADSCDPADPDRAAAASAMHAFVGSIVQQAFPKSDPEGMATAMWSLVHGLAFLHLDGKFDGSSSDATAARVRHAVSAIVESANGTALTGKADTERPR